MRILIGIMKYIKKFCGRYAEKLKMYQGIGVGFVDGDIEIIYQKE